MNLLRSIELPFIAERFGWDFLLHKYIPHGAVKPRRIARCQNASLVQEKGKPGNCRPLNEFEIALVDDSFGTRVTSVARQPNP
jgi:hypothetical protein